MPRAGDAPGEDVELVTIDGLVEQGIVDAEQTALLWIDAKSHAGHVLRGATRLTEQGVPVLLELHPGAVVEHGDPAALFEAVRPYTHFLDVRRRRWDSAERRGRPTPVARLRAEFEHLLDESSAPMFTDLLLLRLPS